MNDRLQKRRQAFGDWLVLFACSIIAGIGFVWFQISGPEIPFVIDTLAATLIFGLIGALRKARRHAWGAASPSTTETLKNDTRPPVLYLRAFLRDKLVRTHLLGYASPSVSEEAERAFCRFGPVVGFGDPSTGVPEPGIAVDFCDSKNWESKIAQLMLSASMIVMVVDCSDGLLVEVRILSQLKLRSVVFVLPPVWSRNTWKRIVSLFGDDLPDPDETHMGVYFDTQKQRWMCMFSTEYSLEGRLEAIGRFLERRSWGDVEN